MNYVFTRELPVKILNKKPRFVRSGVLSYTKTSNYRSNLIPCANGSSVV